MPDTGQELQHKDAGQIIDYNSKNGKYVVSNQNLGKFIQVIPSGEHSRWIDTNISEGHTACFLKVEYGGRILLQNDVLRVRGQDQLNIKAKLKDKPARLHKLDVFIV